MQSAGRILRALFELVLRRGWVSSAATLLTLAKVVDRRVWSFQTPLRQFIPHLNMDCIAKIEQAKLTLDRLADMQTSEIARMLRSQPFGELVARCVRRFPHVSVDAWAQPITRTILRVTCTVTPEFEWHEKTHGSVEPWWLWIEDDVSESIFHSEYVLLHRRQGHEPVTTTFQIPVSEPVPKQYFIRVMSDRWVGAETTFILSFSSLALPGHDTEHTKILPLTPLSKSALQSEQYEKLFSFSHFNPVQTQAFHTL